MSFSDWGSAVDDSFDFRAGTHGNHRDMHEEQGFMHQVPQPGHWTVSSGTAAGSGIDDFADTVHFGGSGDAGAAFGFERPISGSVLGRFAGTNAAKRGKENRAKRLETVEEEKVQIENNSVKDKKKVFKFCVPRLDESRGIRIKGRGGRSRIVREPGLLSISLPERIKSSLGPPMKQRAEAECVRPPSPEPSNRSIGGSSFSGTQNGVRIIGKDGAVVFIPLPTGLGASSRVSRPVSLVKDVSPSKGKSADGGRRARNAKATRGAREIRQQEDMAEVFMSGAIMGSVASSRKSSAKTLHAGGEFVYDHTGAGGSKRTASARSGDWAAPPSEHLPDPELGGDNMTVVKHPTPNSKPGKKGNAENKEKAGKKVNAIMKKAKPAVNDSQRKDDSASKEIPAKQTSSHSEQQHVKTMEPSPPFPLVSLTEVGAQDNFCPAQPPMPEGTWNQTTTSWQPPSVRTISDISRTSGSGDSPEPSIVGWGSAGGSIHSVRNAKAAHSASTEICDIPLGIDEPLRPSAASRVHKINSEIHPIPLALRQDISARSSSHRNPRAEARAAVHHQYFDPTAAPSSPRSQISLARSASQHEAADYPLDWSSPQVNLSARHTVSAQSQQNIKQEVHTSSPQVTHNLNRPSEASSHSFMSQAHGVWSPHRRHSACLPASQTGVLAQQRTYSAFPAQQVFSPTSYLPPTHKQLAPYSHQQPQGTPSPRNYPLPPSSSHQYSLPRHLYSSPPRQSIAVRAPTVFAGRGWISPHPLSVAPSWISDPPQSAIPMPAGLRWTSTGEAPSPAAQDHMTYEEWRAVREQQSVSDKRAEESLQLLQPVAVGPRDGWTNLAEDVEQRARASSKQSENDSPIWRGTERSNWSRTMSSHQGATGASVRENSRDWATTGIGIVRSDGRVQLRMPWDQ